jgi:hypothetical protein
MGVILTKAKLNYKAQFRPGQKDPFLCIVWDNDQKVLVFPPFLSEDLR